MILHIDSVLNTTFQHLIEYDNHMQTLCYRLEVILDINDIYIIHKKPDRNIDSQHHFTFWILRTYLLFKDMD